MAINKKVLLTLTVMASAIVGSQVTAQTVQQRQNPTTATASTQAGSPLKAQAAPANVAPAVAIAPPQGMGAQGVNPQRKTAFGQIPPDYITMPDGTNRPLDINTISRLNEEISRKEFEQKLRDLFAVEEEQLGANSLPAPPTPPVAVAPPVEPPKEEPKPIQKAFENYRFSGVFGSLDDVRGEMLRSDGRLYKINAGTKTDEFVVHSMTADSVDVTFCTKKSKNRCAGERYKMIVGQVVVLEKSGE